MLTVQAPAGSGQRQPRGLQRSTLLATCFGVPTAILVASYAWLALDRGTIVLWDVVVHESGRYTLGDTLLYFGHFLREIPTDLTYALLVLGAAAGALPAAPARGTPRAKRLRHIALATLVAAAGIVAFALFRSAATQGWSGALSDLLQMRTRDDLVAYGSHWHFHWLSTLWFGLVSMFVVPLVLPDAGTHATSLARQVRFMAPAWGTFAALTVVFGVSMDTFTDVRYAGHQAREIVTHAPITGLLAIGIVGLMAARFNANGVDTARSQRHETRAWTLLRWLAAALCVIIPIWVAAVTLSGDAMAAGQSGQGLSAMVAGHVFEHVLDFLLVALVVTGGCALLMEHRAR